MATNIYKTFALVVGIVFLLVGILGFILNPTGGSLLGIFAVNIVHVLVGVPGIAAAYTGWSRSYARGLGIVYVLLLCNAAFLFYFGALTFHKRDQFIERHLCH